jgi:hypothetical protein
MCICWFIINIPVLKINTYNTHTFSEHTKTTFCSQVRFSRVFGWFVTLICVTHTNNLSSLTFLSEIVSVWCNFETDYLNITLATTNLRM